MAKNVKVNEETLKALNVALTKYLQISPLRADVYSSWVGMSEEEGVVYLDTATDKDFNMVCQALVSPSAAGAGLVTMLSPNDLLPGNDNSLTFVQFLEKQGKPLTWPSSKSNVSFMTTPVKVRCWKHDIGHLLLRLAPVSKPQGLPVVLPQAPYVY